MARWIKNTYCPKCGSKDNLGVWDDGSTWCWGGCGYTPPTNLIETYQQKKVVSDLYIKCILPEDAVPILPEIAKLWLGKYHLTNEEIAKVKPLYSYERDLLIFPVWDNWGTLLMWQGRYFGNNPKYPKYITEGSKDLLHILGEPNERIIVTEDLISAVKVGTVINAMPLWGSSMPPETIRRLSSRFKRLGIWLDMNKAKESLKMRSRALPYFDDVQCIVTPLDPKEYNHAEIRRYCMF